MIYEKCIGCRVDKDTYENILLVKGDKTVADFLREVINDYLNN